MFYRSDSALPESCGKEVSDMSTKGERITRKGNLLRLQGLEVLRAANNTRMLTVESSLNRQQRKTVIGWLGKGRVQSLIEGLEKIQERIAKDSSQGIKG